MTVIETLENLALERNPKRRYRIGRVQTIEDLPASLDSCSPHFVLLLAIDGSALEDERMSLIAQNLLSRGLVYVCVWGPDCERVHDLFDEESRDPDQTDQSIVMTTWHPDESLSEAVFFFDSCAYPSAAYEADCRDWVAIAVGNQSWGEEIRSILIRGLNSSN